MSECLGHTAMPAVGMVSAAQSSHVHDLEEMQAFQAQADFSLTLQGLKPALMLT